MRRLILTSISALGVLALAACSAGPAPGADSGDAPAEAAEGITIANFNDVTTWDPANADIGFEAAYLSAVYDPLIQLDGDGAIIPGLATDWEVSDDLKTVTMHLRDDVEFVDGTPFNADAAVANIEHLAQAVRAGEAYTQLDRVTAVDDDTIEISLATPDPTMLPLMAVGRSFMASPAALGSDALAKDPVGSGPYVLADNKPGDQYVFERKDAHWDLGSYPYPDITIRWIQDNTARTNAMLAGQIDVNYGGTQDAEQAEANNWKITKEVATWVGFRFNNHTGKLLEPLGDQRVREALQLAIDAEGLLNSVNGGNGKLTNQLFASGRPGYNEQLNDRIAYDPERARELLAEAGYPDGFAVTMPMAPPFQPWQAAVTSSLADIGVTVTWEDLAMADYMKNSATYPMAVSMLALPGDAPTTVARFVSTTQWYNPEPDFETDSELAELVTQLQVTPAAEQAEIAEQINARLVETNWQNVWYQRENIYVSTQDISVTPIIGQMFPVLRNIQPAG